MQTAKILTTPMLILAGLFLLRHLVQLYQLYAMTRCHRSFHPSMCEGPIHQGYTRFADVERRCQSVLSSAAELKADADREGHNLMYQLSFIDGDWSQDAGEAPLLPFQGSYADPAVVAGPESHLEAVPLASFRLKHIEDMAAQRPGPQTALNASGILTFAIARNSSCSPYYPHFDITEPCQVPEFDLRPGIAKLQVLFQGVYTETRSPGNGGGGERVLCMVGDAVLPLRSSNSTDPWDWAKNRGGGSSNLEPPLVVSDGNILLVLRYPKTATLTTRAVQGVMTSLKAKSERAYFDTVRLVSQLQLSGRGYQFRQEDTELDGAACDDDEDPPEHGAMEHHRLNRGVSPCDIVYQLIPNMMEVIPNWDCKGTDEFCSRLGPFVSTSRPPATATNATAEDMAFTRSAIVVSGLQCESMGGSIVGGTAAARVAAVFRYVPPWEHQPMAAKRTGLSSTTLSAEGVWNPSTGRTHMVACLGVGKEACHYRVTLSVQTTVSMARRGVVAGQITAMDGRSHPPLLFQQRLYGRFAPYVTSSWRRTSYIYTKVDQALELLAASEPAGFRDTFVAKSLLSYPSVDAGGAASGDITDIGSLSDLADELDLRDQCIGKLPPIVPEWIDSSSFLELQILSAGTLVGRSYSPQFRRRSRMRIFELLKRFHVDERQQKMNVSAEFMAYGKNCRGPSPVMSLEGVYNAEDGRMYLIGCRTVHAPRRRLVSVSKDLEDGMDCSIEVIVEYPPTTTRWLISRPAKVFIANTRDDDDPLHFNRTELHMLPVKYRQTRLELHELAMLMVKGFLYIIALLATIWAATR